MRMEDIVKFSIKKLFRKPLKLDTFSKLSKLKYEINEAKDPKIAREKFENEFMNTYERLLKEENPNSIYVFIKQFIDQKQEFEEEFKNLSEVVLKKGDSGIVGDLYRCLPWTDSRFFIKAKTGEQIGGIWSTYSTIDGLKKKEKEVFDKDYNVLLDYVLENGNMHECRVMAKYSDGEVLSKLEDKFLEKCNNVYDICEFAYQKNANEEKFIKKLLGFKDLIGVKAILKEKKDVILEKTKNNPEKAEKYIEYCEVCKDSDIDELKAKLGDSVKKSKLKENQAKGNEDLSL